MARKKKDSGDGLRGDEWIATFSDTMTLLLTFFILLYSFSSVDAKKFSQISSALNSVLTGQSGQTIFESNMSNGNVPLVGEDPEMINSQVGTPKEELYEKVKNFVQKNSLTDIVEVNEDPRGVVLRLRDNVLFESGKADIKEPSKAILDKINSLISTFPNAIIVEGHTDNVPISTYKYESNWELSTSRAVNVLRYFVVFKGQNPERFTAAGYGEYKPVAPNNSDENKAKNRRVNILILQGEKEKGK